MKAGIVKFWSSFLDKIEPDVTLELEEIKFSKKYGHEVCVMHLVGKNAFPIMTAEEILTNPKARAGLSKEDLIAITRLDMEIKLRKQSMRIVEHDRNGTVVMMNEVGDKTTYSEREVSSNVILLNMLNGKDAHNIGYRVGFKEGLGISSQKKRLARKLRDIFSFK